MRERKILADTFAFANTKTEDGNNAGEITVDGYSNLILGQLTATGNAQFNSDVTINGGLTIGGKSFSSTELGYLYGVSEGIALPSKAVVLDTSSDITAIRNITVSGKLTTPSITLGDTDITANADDINKLGDITGKQIDARVHVVLGVFDLLGSRRRGP